MMADAPEHFVQMGNAREAIARGWTHIERQVLAAETAVREEPNLSFDLARALIESACLSILNERGVQFRRDGDLPALFRVVRQQLPLLPPAASSETGARRSLDHALSGMQSTIQAICELRNDYGFASHGHEAESGRMELTQAVFVVGAADVIIGLLYRAHMQDRTVPSGTERPSYEDNEDFNNFIDENHEICTILESEFWPSEILFQMEPETYRLRLAEFSAEGAGPEEVDA